MAGIHGLAVKSSGELGITVDGTFDDWRTLRLKLAASAQGGKALAASPVSFPEPCMPHLDVVGAIPPDSAWTPPQVGPNRTPK